MSRVLALLVSVALIAGAFYVRGRVNAAPAEGGSSDVPGRTEGAPGDGGEDGASTLVCADEFAEVCEELDAGALGLTVTVESAGETTAALAGGTAPPALWLVPAPWPEVAGILRESAQAQAGPAPAISAPLARSPLVLSGFAERVDALSAACGATLTWQCIGEQAGRPWPELGLEGATGNVRPGHTDPTQSATGLLVLGAAVVSYHGRTDLNRNDLAVPAFADWFANLESAVPDFTPSSGSLVTELLTRGLASYDVVGTTDAEATLRLSTASRGPLEIRTVTPEPIVTADAVLVSYGGQERLDEALTTLGEPLQEAFTSQGWRGEGVADAAPLPETAGLPSAGFLVALQQRWEEVAR